MPQKYRKMGDFHEYYSGARVAPYLTIFIGGNHEASNYLFELYYGGWVAPNIYYMGAANILRLGPLRIAGLSGIWKGYDYRKPHFERLPYNSEDYHSIFHVRELDVRKLLSVRSQVDIGLSHDWPKGAEWRGKHRWLFNKKDRFEVDAVNGKLGSVAAAQCLDRLRPAYWFSAHLHIKYPALILHGQQGGVQRKPAFDPEWSSRNRNFNDDHSESASTLINSEMDVSSYDMPHQLVRTSPQTNGYQSRPQSRPQVSAWQNFHIGAQQDDLEERDRVLKERQERQDEEARTGVRSLPQYRFEETFKQVETTDDLGRSIASVTTSSPEPGESNEIPNLDGCGASSLKRRRREMSISEASEQQQNQHALMNTDHQRAIAIATFDGTAASSTIVASTIENNPDAVEMDLDDTDSDTGRANALETIEPGSSVPGAMVAAPSKTIPIPITGTSDHSTNALQEMLTSALSDDCEDGGVRLNPLAQSFQPLPSKSPSTERKESAEMNSFPQPFTSSSPTTERRKSDEMNPVAQSFTPEGSISSLREPRENHTDLGGMVTAERQDIPIADGEPKSMSDEADDYQDGIGGAPMVDNEVSEEMRAQLAALSDSFAPQVVKKSESLPFPEAITNNSTNFLALDKCESNRDFLQLLEVEAISETPLQGRPSRPFKLQYDPEWLAVLRVFAPDLELGGGSRDVVAPDRGETYYRDRIIEEAQWIEEHIVEKGLLGVPENFGRTAPVYDPELQVDSSEMPREYTNPQTSEFCNLLGIDNPFNVSEKERDARIARGPRPETDRQGFKGGRREGGRGGGGRGRGGGYNNRGGGRGGGRGGRPGGRGRGRGRW